MDDNATRKPFRVSLGMFMLLCVGASLLLAWIGLTWQRWEFEHTYGGVATSVRDFSSIDGEEDRVFPSTMRAVRSKRDLTDLKNSRDTDCAQLQCLQIYSPEAWHAFQPSDFPRLTTVELVDIALSDGALSKLSELQDLQFLTITERLTDPASAIDELQNVAALRHLVLTVGTQMQFESFPQLNQLRTLVISSPNLTPAQLVVLRERLPNCEVSVSE